MQELIASLTEPQRWLLTDGRRLLHSSDCLRSPDLTAAQKVMLVQQLEWRRRSRERFPQPERWMWSDRSLSQASDWWSACYKASLYPAGIQVVDGCCGAGVDSVALADSRDVLAVDSDPWMVALAASNAASHETTVRGFVDKLERFSLPGSAWLHVDPDRRTAGRRTIVDTDFSPRLIDILDLAASVTGAAIKIAPATKLSDASKMSFEPRGIRLWLGNRGECRQQLLLVGDAMVGSFLSRMRDHAPETENQRLPGSVAILLAEPESEKSGFSETYFSGSGCPQDSHSSCGSDRIGPIVADLNSTLFAADLHRAWALENNLRPVCSEYGFYSAEELIPTPWASTFEVLEILPWDDRKIRKWLKMHDAGLVEVKSRLVKLDASVFQKRYSQAHGQPIALLVTRLGTRVRCLICRRIVHTKESCCP